MEYSLFHITTSEMGNAFKVQKLQLLFENQTQESKKHNPKIRQGPKTPNQWCQVFHKSQCWEIKAIVSLLQGCKSTFKHADKVGDFEIQKIKIQIKNKK